MSELPPCGIYRTRESINAVPAGRLVYFHNHGDPGAGIYLPAGWQHNRATWQANGNLLGPNENADKLEPLPAEGFYRVKQPFYCCEKECRQFEINLLVQLGYNAAADALVFTPTLSSRGMGLPETGSRVDTARLANLELLRVAISASDKPVNASHLH